jgi:hypothetical protein
MNLPSSRRARPLAAAPLPRLPAVGPAPPALRVDPLLNCPRCLTVLTDPHGIGLCPRCGYCRSLEVEGVAVLAAMGKHQRWEPVPRGLRHALRVAPAAMLALCVAFGAVVPLAFLADRRFLPGSRERALWSAANLLCGLLLLLAGQAWAVAVLKRIKERVSWSDLLSPFHLWGLALRRLPTTAWPVGLGGSGMLTVLAAVLWVGGLSYWFSLYPAPEEDSRSTHEVASRQRGPRDAVEVTQVARTLELPKVRKVAPEKRPSRPSSSSDVLASVRIPAADARPTERCVIVGFVPASNGQEPGLVLATLRQGQLTFAGVVRNGLKQKPELLDRLAKLGRSRSPVDGLNLDAVWVRPELTCEVHQSGADDKGELVDPNLKGLVEE